MSRLSPVALIATVVCLSIAGSASAADLWVTDLVDNTNFSDGTCTLREAITAANTDAPFDACPAGSGADTIYFRVTGTLNLIGQLPEVTADLSINGPGVELLLIDANGFGRHLRFSSSVSEAVVQGLRLLGGDTSSSGGAISSSADQLIVRDAKIDGNTATLRGGGVSASGEITIERTTIDGNEASIGGGLSVSSASTSLTMTASTVSNNVSLNGAGGMVVKDATVFTSTVSGNTGVSAGGIEGDGFEGSNIVLYNSTVVENVGSTAGGIRCSNDDCSLTIFSSIVAGNTGTFPDHYDSAFGVLTSLGNNVIGNNQGSDFVAGLPNAENDYVGSFGAPISADLGLLADNGGPTFTHLPNGTSTYVLDQGSCDDVSAAIERYDQRGRAGNVTAPLRAVDNPTATNADDGCDVGAVERGASGTVRSKLDAMALLSGPHTDVIMSTALNQAGLLPLAQPYAGAPWTYGDPETLTSVPADMVDWVLVTLFKGGHEDASGLVISDRKALLLKDNGDIEATNGVPGFTIRPGLYYVGVQHRNHLAVVSDAPIFLTWDETTDLDLRTVPAYGTAPQEIVSSSQGPLFEMWPGDSNGTGAVNARDALLGWLATAPATGYLADDYNLDGSVNRVDLLVHWLPSHGRWSE